MLYIILINKKILSIKNISSYHVNYKYSKSFISYKKFIQNIVFQLRYLDIFNNQYMNYIYESVYESVYKL